MTSNRRRRFSRFLPRRIRAHHLKTSKPYMAAAEVVMTEQALGRRYLSDQAVPARLATPGSSP